MYLCIFKAALNLIDLSANFLAYEYQILLLIIDSSLIKATVIYIRFYASIILLYCMIMKFALTCLKFLVRKSGCQKLRVQLCGDVVICKTFDLLLLYSF